MGTLHEVLKMEDPMPLTKRLCNKLEKNISIGKVITINFRTRILMPR
jgi:hypothetical protein